MTAAGKLSRRVMGGLGLGKSGKRSVGTKVETPVRERPRNISKEIRRHRRTFDYLIIPTEEGRMFVVDASMKLDKAIAFYLMFRPNEDPMANYSEGRARYNVVTQTYELVDDDAPVQGTFPVHVIRMED